MELHDERRGTSTDGGEGAYHADFPVRYALPADPRESFRITLICVDVEQATHVRRIREGEVQIRGGSDETAVLSGNADRIRRERTSGAHGIGSR